MNAEKYVLKKLIDYLAERNKQVLESLTHDHDSQKTAHLRGEFMALALTQSKIKLIYEEVKQMEKQNDE